MAKLSSRPLRGLRVPTFGSEVPQATAGRYRGAPSSRFRQVPMGEHLYTYVDPPNERHLDQITELLLQKRRQQLREALRDTLLQRAWAEGDLRRENL